MVIPLKENKSAKIKNYPGVVICDMKNLLSWSLVLFSLIIIISTFVYSLIYGFWGYPPEVITIWFIIIFCVMGAIFFVWAYHESVKERLQ